MSLEHWQETIQHKPGEHQRPTFFVTDEEHIKGSDATIRYLLVSEGDDEGLEEGLYVQTNIPPEVYDHRLTLRSLTATYVAVDLTENDQRAMELAKKRGTLPGGLNFMEESEYRERTRPVVFSPVAIAPNGGGVVLRLS